MLLAIDTGNTETVVGVFRGDELSLHWRSSTREDRTADELTLLIGGFLEREGLTLRSDVDGMVVASVVPAQTQALRKKGDPDALRSAVQNANYQGQEKGLDVDVDNLYVKNAYANEGPRMKRIRPAPMGRAFRYQRRMAHLGIVLAERKAEGAGPAETAEPVQAASGSKKGKTAGKPVAKKAAKKSSAKKAAKK